MDYINHNTTLRTNKHLNLEERFYVKKRIAAGDSVTAIATVLGRSRTTIYTELKRGSVVQIRQGKARLVYLADSGQLTYKIVDLNTVQLFNFILRLKDGKKYFVKEGKYRQKEVFTNSGTFIAIKKSIFDEDFYEEETDDR